MTALWDRRWVQRSVRPSTSTLEVACAAVVGVAAAAQASFVFVPVQQVIFDEPQFPTMTAAADIDGDGLPDLIVPGRNSAGLVHVFHSVGGGLVESAQVLEFGGQTDWAALGDLDGDGVLDLAVAIRNGPRGIALRTGIGDGTFAEKGALLGGTRDVRALELVDLNNDGDLDIVSVDYEAASLRIHRNDGTGAFTADPPIRLVPHSGSLIFAGHVVAADFDGDGWSDLLVTATGAGRIIQFNNRGDGTFGPAINRRVPAFDGIQPGLVNTVAADMNGDGAPDLVSPWIMGFLLQRVGVLPNDGSGNFDEVLSTPTVFGPITFYGAVADFDGDGKPDIVIGHALPGVIGVIRNLGSFEFAAPEIIPLNSFVRHLLPIDMDGDGRPDLVAVDAPANRVHILINETPAPPEGGVASGPEAPPPPPVRIGTRGTWSPDIDPALRNSTDGADLALWLLERP